MTREEDVNRLLVWFAVLAPGGTPKEIIDKLSAEIARILAMPDFREKLVSQRRNYFARPHPLLSTIIHFSSYQATATAAPARDRAANYSSASGLHSSPCSGQDLFRSDRLLVRKMITRA